MSLPWTLKWRFTAHAMRGLGMVVLLFISAASSLSGEGWIMLRGPAGITLSLPPGSWIGVWEGTVRVELPVVPGTTLRGIYLLIETGPGVHPEGMPRFLQGRWFYLSEMDEGAAGSFYESLRYVFPLPGGRFGAVIFVIHTIDPGAFDRPPPPYPRAEVLDLIVRILGTLAVASPQRPIWMP